VCPFCLSTLAMALIGAASSGGVAAIVLKKPRVNGDAEISTSQEGGEHAIENRIAQ
jgi:hypothetical protein